ncbi:hypothetical protein [Streptomyces sp. NBC_00687]|uniref:hypothetical protein n=1 Tax=Streptomyces sp. NBC_00687 TaxID=2975807 RepID=UPI00225A36B0|nr:hypothetical protein [Streptomyces sp. NBC_00687]MCX4912883.1 hypothetical protein [Streptomyces sp. NBC_00687]
MLKPWYLTLDGNGPRVQEYLAAQLERHQAERDFIATWATPDPMAPQTEAETLAGAYMDAAWEAECAAYVAAWTEYPDLPVGP